jgi:hypothetical protein
LHDDQDQDRNAFVGVLSNDLPSTIFVHPNGFFSLHPPRPTDLDKAQTKTAPNKRKHQQEASEEEDIPLKPKRTSKSKTQTIILSDDEDDRPEVAASKKKMGNKVNAEQLPLPKVVKTDGTS